MKAEGNSKDSTDLKCANDRKWVIRKLCRTWERRKLVEHCGRGWQVCHVKYSACCKKMSVN